jgi:hypothetical protein
VLLEAQATVDIKDRNGETQHYLSPALRSASKTANTDLSEIISVSTDIISDVFYQWHTLSWDFMLAGTSRFDQLATCASVQTDSPLIHIICDVFISDAHIVLWFYCISARTFY